MSCCKNHDKTSCGNLCSDHKFFMLLSILYLWFAHLTGASTTCGPDSFRIILYYVLLLILLENCSFVLLVRGEWVLSVWDHMVETVKAISYSDDHQVPRRHNHYIINREILLGWHIKEANKGHWKCRERTNNSILVL